MNMIRSPIKWVGGKSRLRKRILQLLPPHDCYVEVFGGAAWTLLAKRPSKTEILNDIDADVINFFEVVKAKPEEFLRSFDWELVSRDKFERLRNQDVGKLTDIQRAHRFYYLIMASWGGEFRTPRFQTSISDAGHGNRLVGALRTLRERIEPVHERLRTVIIERLDWQECIRRYDAPYKDKRVVMYLDPPYPTNNCNYVYNMRDWEEHAVLVDALRSLKARFVLSGYDSPEMRKLCKGLRITPIEFIGGMPGNDNGTRKTHREVLVTNFAPHVAKHA